MGPQEISAADRPSDDVMAEGPTQQRRGSGLWFGLAALVPIVCCGLPLLLAAGATAGTGAVLGGVAGAMLLLVALVLTAVALRRRRATRDTDLNTDPGPRANS